MTTRLSPLDMAGNEIQNVVLQSLAAFPAHAVGRIFYYTGGGASGPGTYWSDGAAWHKADASSVSLVYGTVVTEQAFGQAPADGVSTDVSRADHTHGTPPVPRLDQLAAPTANYDLNGQRLTGSGDPVAGGDLVTKTYADALRQGLDPKESVRAASTGNVNTAAAPAAVDGIAGSAGDRWLLKDQTTPSQNGIWIFNGTGAALTRAVDADSGGDLSIGSMTFVEAGTANGGQLWVVTATGATPWVPGASSSTWTQFSGASQVSAGAGLTASGNVFAVGGTAGRISVAGDAVDIDAGYVGQASITTLGTIATGVWQGTAVDVAHGGTGATDAATARANLGAAGGGYAADIGDGAATAIVVTHNLGTRDVVPRLRRNTAPYDYAEADYEATTVNSVTYRFTTAPTAAQFRAIITRI